MAAGMRLNDRIAEGLAALDEAEPLADAARRSRSSSRACTTCAATCCFRSAAMPTACASTSSRAGTRARGRLARGRGGGARRARRRLLPARPHAVGPPAVPECVALARQHGFGRLEVANLPMVGWSGMHLAEIGAAVAVGHEAIALAHAGVAAARRADGAHAGRLGRRPGARPARRGRGAGRARAAPGASPGRQALRGASCSASRA